MTDGEPALLVAGRVGRPHGLDGSFHVTLPRPALLAEGIEIHVGERAARISRRAGTDLRPIVRLEGYSDRDAAESIRGATLLVAQAAAPELGPGEWWAEQFEGCEVHDHGRTVGIVRRMVALPSCECLEVAREGGGDLLVPLVSDAVRSVEIEARRIDVDLAFLGERDPTET